MADRNAVQKQLAIAQCDEAIKWNKGIMNSAKASEQDKKAAKFALEQAEQAKRDILSGKVKIAAED